MITATTFSRGYTSFWQEATPWLNGYVNHINSAELERNGSPLDGLDKMEYRSINNLIAFIQYCDEVQAKDKVDLNKSFQKAKSVFKHIATSVIKSYKIDEINTIVIEQQVKNLHYAYPNKGIYNPRFPGYSLILESEADFLYKKTLVEVKAADRKVTPGDIKQLITYMILNKISREPIEITCAELYNPRHAMKYSTQIEDLCSNISTLTFSEICILFENFIENINSNSN